MKVVIDIPEEVYESAKNGTLNEMQSMYICGSVVEGTPLPKGHGKLKDTDALIKEMKAQAEKRKDKLSIWETATVELALDRYAPTIIEADKESDPGDGRVIH